MPKDLRKRGVQDRTSININDPSELQDWANKFDVDPSLIVTAVLNAGAFVNNVREWLHNRGYIRAS